MTRIIAGAFASRRILTPSGRRTRPTTDRVKESVFAQLASWWGTAGGRPADQLHGVDFLDLYAGSGGIGMEALSRGARVTLVESDRLAVRVIEANLRALSATGKVVMADVARYLTRLDGPAGFDIVWMDPPYELPDIDLGQILRLVGAPGVVKPHGRVVVERASHTSTIEFPQGFLSIGQRHYGDTVIYIAEKGSE